MCGMKALATITPLASFVRVYIALRLGVITSGERAWQPLGWADPMLVFQNHPDGLLRVIRDRAELEVARADQRVFFHRALHPRQKPFPVALSKKHQGESGDTAGLHQR